MPERPRYNPEAEKVRRPSLKRAGLKTSLGLAAAVGLGGLYHKMLEHVAGEETPSVASVDTAPKDEPPIETTHGEKEGKRPRATATPSPTITENFRKLDKIIQATPQNELEAEEAEQEERRSKESWENRQRLKQAIAEKLGSKMFDDKMQLEWDRHQSISEAENDMRQLISKERPQLFLIEMDPSTVNINLFSESASGRVRYSNSNILSISPDGRTLSYRLRNVGRVHLSTYDAVDMMVESAYLDEKYGKEIDPFIIAKAKGEITEEQLNEVYVSWDERKESAERELKEKYAEYGTVVSEE